MKTWNERITDARELRGLSKAAFARQVGVSSATVTDWESGKIKTLEASNMLQICDVLGIRPKWLLKGELPMEDEAAKRPPVSDESFEVALALDRMAAEKRAAFKTIIGQNVERESGDEDDQPTHLATGDHTGTYGEQ